MVAASAISTAPPAAPPLVRPAGAAKLNFIDCNPGVRTAGPGALTPVVIMHGLLGNARNFQGWGAKLVKVCMQALHEGLFFRVLRVDRDGKSGTSATTGWRDKANVQK